MYCVHRYLIKRLIMSIRKVKEYCFCEIIYFIFRGIIRYLIHKKYEWRLIVKKFAEKKNYALLFYMKYQQHSILSS